MISIKTMNDDDRNFLILGVLAPLAAWWLFIGRKRYSVKGMK